MANVRAFRNGNWNDTNPATSPWGTGGVLYAPQNTDVVYSNNFTVTLDANYTTPTGLTVTNASITGTTFRDGGTSATAGGSFTLGNNCVLNANVSAFSATCVTGAINNPNTATINGTITGGTSSGAVATGLSVSGGNGTYYINGDIVGGSGTGGNQYGVSFSNAGSLIVVGNVKNNTTSSSNYNHGLSVGGSLALSVTITGTVSSISTNSLNNNYPLNITNPLANVTVNGNVTSAGAATPIIVTSVGVLTINGSVTGGSAYGLSTGTGTVNIYGNIVPGTGNSGFGVWVGGAGTVNITGNIVGGALTTSSAAINNNSSGPVNIYGTLEGGVNQSGYSTSGGSNGTLTATRMKGNGYGVGTTGIAQTYAAYNYTNALFYAQELEFGPLGMAPVYGTVKLVPLSSNVGVVRLTTGAAKTLVDASSTLNFPATSNVRSGVSYNAGNLVGTCAVPNPSSVVSGVAVDATVGTASLSPASVWSYSLSSVSSNSVGEKLKKTANTSDIIALG